MLAIGQHLSSFIMLNTKRNELPQMSLLNCKNQSKDSDRTKRPRIEWRDTFHTV